LHRLVNYIAAAFALIARFAPTPRQPHVPLTNLLDCSLRAPKSPARDTMADKTTLAVVEF
jgi:hypothetical protein